MVHVARPVLSFVRVLEVQVVVAGLDLIDGNPPGLFVLDPVVPPLLFRLEFLDADRLALVVTLDAGQIRMLVVPDFGGFLVFGEEQAGWCECRCRD